jgi:hypothetical protein
VRKPFLVMPVIFPTIGLELQKMVDEKLDYESKKENNEEEGKEKGE